MQGFIEIWEKDQKKQGEFQISSYYNFSLVYMNSYASTRMKFHTVLGMIKQDYNNSEIIHQITTWSSSLSIETSLDNHLLLCLCHLYVPFHAKTELTFVIIFAVWGLSISQMSILFQSNINFYQAPVSIFNFDRSFFVFKYLCVHLVFQSFGYKGTWRGLLQKGTTYIQLDISNCIARYIWTSYALMRWAWCPIC